MLLIDKLGEVRRETLTDLRSRGVMLGAPDGPPSATPAVEFVALHAASGGIDTMLLSAQRWREVVPRILVVGMGLDDLDDLERALRGGITLAGGQMGRSAQVAPRRDLGSAAHRICELLNHLALDRDTGVIAEAVRGDVALTYRLLRYANSPAIGLRRAVETVDDAVTLLGRTELYRWLSVQLMSAAAARQASKALEEAALARGRILEAVARKRNDDNPGAHFTLGLLSLIEQLLQTPMASALAPLRLSDTARQALLEKSGPWADRLRLLDLLDEGDAERADALAIELGVQAELPAIVEDAWRWASEVREGAVAQK
jgi:EAL and modified HD-GYP domain-containing signal transduction protein